MVKYIPCEVDFDCVFGTITAFQQVDTTFKIRVTINDTLHKYYMCKGVRGFGDGTAQEITQEEFSSEAPSFWKNSFDIEAARINKGK